MNAKFLRLAFPVAALGQGAPFGREHRPQNESLTSGALSPMSEVGKPSRFWAACGRMQDARGGVSHCASAMARISKPGVSAAGFGQYGHCQLEIEMTGVNVYGS